MSPDIPSTKQLNDYVRAVLEEGSRAVLATVLQSTRLGAGAKILIREDQILTGDIGDQILNPALIAEAAKFIAGRDEARTIRINEIAPHLTDFADSSVLFERIEVEPKLVIAGAGHVGASLARLAALLRYRVTLIDDRAEFVTREMFSSPAEKFIELVCNPSWAEAIRDAVGGGGGVAIAIVTRGHKQDEDCLRAALSTNPDYVGMIGSKRRTNIVLDKLREEGFAAEQLQKVRAPIGLDIGAISPEEVALSILAEVVAERRGGRGGSLSVWRRA
jgi:xanthine dehydrogenase accessory factor